MSELERSELRDRLLGDPERRARVEAFFADVDDEPADDLVEVLKQAQREAAERMDPSLVGVADQVREVPQDVWDAVYGVIRTEPRDAFENARTWRAVNAALRALGYTV